MTVALHIAQTAHSKRGRGLGAGPDDGLRLLAPRFGWGRFGSASLSAPFSKLVTSVRPFNYPTVRHSSALLRLRKCQGILLLPRYPSSPPYA